MFNIACVYSFENILISLFSVKTDFFVKKIVFPRSNNESMMFQSKRRDMSASLFGWELENTPFSRTKGENEGDKCIFLEVMSIWVYLLKEKSVFLIVYNAGELSTFEANVLAIVEPCVLS